MYEKHKRRKLKNEDSQQQKNCLEIQIGKKHTPTPIHKRNNNGFKVEISKLLKTNANEKKSAVDRTPLHNKFLLEKNE